MKQGLITRLLNDLFKMLGADQIKNILDMVLDAVEENNASNSKVMFICKLLRTILGVPDNDEPQVVPDSNEPQQTNQV